MISQAMYERSRFLRPDSRWTSYIQEHYPPAQKENVVVAWDPQIRGGRWVLCYDTEDTMPVGPNQLARVRYLKAFYIWQGENNAFLSPGPNLVQWLREHDTFSEAYAGEWDDRQFEATEQAREDAENREWDEFAYQMRHEYQQGWRDNNGIGSRLIYATS